MRFITKSMVEYKDFTKNMTLLFYADAYPSRSDEESEESSIFMQQTILIEGKEMIVDVLIFVVEKEQMNCKRWVEQITEFQAL